MTDQKIVRFDPPVCDQCGGTGVLPPKDENTDRLCHKCGFRRWAEERLRPHFHDVQVSRSIALASPLFKTEGAVARALTTNMMLTSWWDDAKNDLATWLTVCGPHSSGPGSSYDVVTDAQLVERYFSPRGYDKSEGLVTASFSDTMTKPNILIIRLGFYLHDSKALGAIVYETLRARELIGGHISIVVNEPLTPWAKSHRAYAPELDAYFKEKFTAITIAKRKAA